MSAALVDPPHSLGPRSSKPLRSQIAQQPETGGPSRAAVLTSGATSSPATHNDHLKGSLYTLVYVVVLGTLCALVLTGAGAFTAPYRRAVARAEEIRNILGCLRVPHEPGLTPEGLLEVFARNIDTQDRGGLRLYLYRREGGGVKAVAVPFGGPGLWGPIRGFLALESDMRTIRGITFHKQQETPGLGGEIAAAPFRRQFEGKSIVDESGRPGIRILRRGGATDGNEVDGITGATVTCERVQAMLNAIITRVAKVRYVDAR